MDDVGRKLHRSSIVFIVDAPNPDLFTADFLDDKQIFAGAEPVRSTVIPPLAQHVFEDGRQFEAVESRIKIEISYPEGHELHSLEDVEGVQLSGRRLIPEISHMQIKALGINYQLVLGDGRDLQAFAEPLPPDTTVTQVNAQRPYEEGCNLNTLLTLMWRKDRQQKAVRAELNFHFDFPVDLDRRSRRDHAEEVLARWPDLFATIPDVLEEVKL